MNLRVHFARHGRPQVVVSLKKALTLTLRRTEVKIHNEEGCKQKDRERRRGIVFLNVIKNIVRLTRRRK